MGKISENRPPSSGGWLVVVELEAHAVVNLVVLEGDVVLVGVVPLLDPDLVGPRPRLRRHQLLQVADGVVLVALHAHLLPQSIVEHHLDHLSLFFVGENPRI